MHSYSVGVRLASDRGTPFTNQLPLLTIHESMIHGQGLFSNFDVHCGTVLLQLSGKMVSHDYDPKLSSENRNWIGVGYGSWIELDEGQQGSFINHSCKPNVVVNDRLQIVTIAPITTGEEVLLDYSTTELDPFWQMDCNCGQGSCRRLLKSFQFLPYELKTKYGPYIAPVFTVVGEEMMMDNSSL